MPLINCIIHLEWNWSKDCLMSTTDETLFTIKKHQYVAIVTLWSKDNVKLEKLLEDGFDRPVYWNEYQTKIKTNNLDNNNPTRFPVDAAFQGVRRLFVFAFNNTNAIIPNNQINNIAFKVERNSHKKYFLPRVNITNYNVPFTEETFKINQLMT